MSSPTNQLWSPQRTCNFTRDPDFIVHQWDLDLPSVSIPEETLQLLPSGTVNQILDRLLYDIQTPRNSNMDESFANDELQRLEGISQCSDFNQVIEKAIDKEDPLLLNGYDMPNIASASTLAESLEMGQVPQHSHVDQIQHQNVEEEEKQQHQHQQNHDFQNQDQRMRQDFCCDWLAIALLQSKSNDAKQLHRKIRKCFKTEFQERFNTRNNNTKTLKVWKQEVRKFLKDMFELTADNKDIAKALLLIYSKLHSSKTNKEQFGETANFIKEKLSAKELNAFYTVFVNQAYKQMRKDFIEDSFTQKILESIRRTTRQ